MTDTGQHDPSGEQSRDVAFTQEIEAAPSPAVQATMDQMTDRLQTVIDAAERAAEAIRFDAEAQARQHLAEAQQKADRLTAERVRLIAELTDDLIDHASVVKQHSEQMVGALEQAIQSVSGRIDEVTAEPAPAAAEPEPTPEPEPAPFGSADDPGLTAPIAESFPASTYEAPFESVPAEAAPLPPEPEGIAEPEPVSGPELAEPEPAYAEPEPPVAYPEFPPETAPEPAEPEPAEPEPAEPESPAVERAPEPEPTFEPPPPEPEPPAAAEPESPTSPEAELTDARPEPAPVPENESFAAEPAAPPDALLRATQLAVAGSEREDVAEMLRTEYGIDPTPVLDRIFGPA
jgi:vacuolar-type H+-ATPase subunit H